MSVSPGSWRPCPPSHRDHLVVKETTCIIIDSRVSSVYGSGYPVMLLILEYDRVKTAAITGIVSAQ